MPLKLSSSYLGSHKGCPLVQAAEASTAVSNPEIKVRVKWH